MQKKENQFLGFNTPNPKEISDSERETEVENEYLNAVSILRKFLENDVSQIRTFEELSNHAYSIGSCIEQIIKSLRKTAQIDTRDKCSDESKSSYIYSLEEPLKEKPNESPKKSIIARKQRDGTITVNVFTENDIDYWVKIPSQSVPWTQLLEKARRKICACHRGSTYSPDFYSEDIQGFVLILKKSIKDLLSVIAQREKTIREKFLDKKSPDFEYQ